jgi:hypothetical protein
MSWTWIGCAVFYALVCGGVLLWIRRRVVREKKKDIPPPKPPSSELKDLAETPHPNGTQHHPERRIVHL